MNSKFKAFEKLLHQAKKTPSKSKDLCDWVVLNMDKDWWTECRYHMVYEGVDAYELSRSISESGVY